MGKKIKSLTVNCSMNFYTQRLIKSFLKFPSALTQALLCAHHCVSAVGNVREKKEGQQSSENRHIQCQCNTNKSNQNLFFFFLQKIVSIFDLRSKVYFLTTLDVVQVPHNRYSERKESINLKNQLFGTHESSILYTWSISESWEH